MHYVITYKDSDQMYHMDGVAKMFIGEHLETIGKKHKISAMDDALSESHLLAILEYNKIRVDILEEDGSKVEW